MRELNIYKVSGVAKIGYTEKVYYWLAGTNDLANTRAMNYVLSELNLANTKLSVVRDTDKKVELMNLIDLYTLILEGMFMAQESEVISIENVGNVLSNMVLNDAFNSITDDITVRTNNLDALIVDFENRINNIPVNIETDVEFDAWFKSIIIDENYNDTPQNVLRDYQPEVDKVGASYTQTLAQKLSDSGPAYLYMFMTDKQINACNDIIKRRYNQEIKNWKWYTRISRGAYSEETILNLFDNGCTLEYQMTPEDKIQELFDYNEKNGGGKVGALATGTIIAIIMAVVACLSLLLSAAQFAIQVYKLTYEMDDDYKNGVPDQSADGWDYGDAVAYAAAGGSLTKTDEELEAEKSKSNTLIYLGLAALALVAFV